MKIVEISVSEPWDFDGPDGPNNIVGILCEGALTERQYIAVLSIKALAFRNINYNAVALSPRYEGEACLANFLAGRKVYVNGEFGQIADGRFIRSGEHQIIGSCHLKES
ncbi:MULTISPECIES: hypothetical protein [Hyphobacterium]|uniref:Uncharacterized protein n=1 Tax=Hyphobacterium vulgare TaxID=1736751 RepID=A0ABV6ZX73_9PROT